jgi:hypothetical protein
MTWQMTLDRRVPLPIKQPQPSSWACIASCGYGMSNAVLRLKLQYNNRKIETQLLANFGLMLHSLLLYVRPCSFYTFKCILLCFLLHSQCQESTHFATLSPHGLSILVPAIPTLF